MANCYSRSEDCKSKLGKRMQAFRADRPSEWLMDEFIRGVEELCDREAKMVELLKRFMMQRGHGYAYRGPLGDILCGCNDCTKARELIEEYEREQGE